VDLSGTGASSGIQAVGAELLLAWAAEAAAKAHGAERARCVLRKWAVQEHTCTWRQAVPWDEQSASSQTP